MKYISTNIKVLRSEARLTIEELSELTGISAENIKLFEKGKLVPTEGEVELLCKPLRIHYEDIIERDILSERNEAGKKMRHSSDRSDYNWYLGDKKIFGLYLAYIIGMVVLVTFVTVVSKLTNLSLFLKIDPQTNDILPATLLQSFLTGYILSAYVSGVSFIIWLLIKLKYRFQWWHLFIISIIGGGGTLVGLINILGIIVMLPSLGYSLYRVIKGGKK